MEPPPVAHQSLTKPKAPVLSKSNPPAPPMPPDPPDAVPFRMFRTRYGTVYHVNQRCSYLIAPKTGVVAEARLCVTCRNEAQARGGVPQIGDPMYMREIGSDAHPDPQCPFARGAGRFYACKKCGARG